MGAVFDPSLVWYRESQTSCPSPDDLTYGHSARTLLAGKLILIGSVVSTNPSTHCPRDIVLHASLPGPEARAACFYSFLLSWAGRKCQLDPFFFPVLQTCAGKKAGSADCLPGGFWMEGKFRVSSFKRPARFKSNGNNNNNNSYCGWLARLLCAALDGHFTCTIL